jgi:hypothetical protein
MNAHSDNPAAADGSPTGAAKEAARRPLLGRRRKFLVNRRYQLRVTAMTALVVVVLLVFLNVTLYSAATRATGELLRILPEYEALAKAQDRAMIVLVALASLVFLAGVVAVGILETHKTAGAAVNLRQRFEDVAKGKYLTVLRLRKNDNLQELVRPFNHMCRALQERTWNDVEVLETLASRVERSGDGFEPAEVATELRRLAKERRRRVE